jgi:hypothetical protein
MGSGWFFRHAFFERADSFTDPLAEFGQFFGTENEQGDKEDDQEVGGLKQAFEHDSPPELNKYRFITLSDEPGTVNVVADWASTCC